MSFSSSLKYAQHLNLALQAYLNTEYWIWNVSEMEWCVPFLKLDKYGREDLKIERLLADYFIDLMMALLKFCFFWKCRGRAKIMELISLKWKSSRFSWKAHMHMPDIRFSCFVLYWVYVIHVNNNEKCALELFIGGYKQTQTREKRTSVIWGLMRQYSPHYCCCSFSSFLLI